MQTMKEKASNIEGRALWTCCLILRCCLSLHAAEQNTPATLRAAVTDLMATHGDKYPNGKEYLARLAAIGADAAAFKALQREALVANPLVSGQPGRDPAGLFLGFAPEPAFPRAARRA